MVVPILLDSCPNGACVSSDRAIMAEQISMKDGRLAIIAAIFLNSSTKICPIANNVVFLEKHTVAIRSLTVRTFN